MSRIMARWMLRGTWIAWVGLLSVSTRAELVSFAKGGQVQVPITKKGASIRLETPDGAYEFHADEIRTIVPGFDPEDEWESRRKAALAGGTAERYRAVRWALENGLTTQAVEVLGTARPIRAEDQPIARMQAALARLSRPYEDPDLEPLRRSLGENACLARGPHTVLLHQHAEKDADERVDVLERVLTSYYLLLAADGIELPVPRRRMASVWFADKHDYLAFLRAENATPFLTTRGYFHPGRNAVFAYDARNADAQKTSRAAIAARRSELQQLIETIEAAPAKSRVRVAVPGESSKSLSRDRARELVEQHLRDLNRQEILLDLDFRSLDLGTAAHEMVHQLIANSGLAPQHDDFPIWLHEGFAMQFEVFRGGRWAGVGQPHEIRLSDWRSVQTRSRVTPLLRDLGQGHGYQRDLYAQSWALVYYLVRERPRQFLGFLDLLRAPRVEEPSAADRTVKAFEAAFGSDLDDFERQWVRFMSSQRTLAEVER